MRTYVFRAVLMFLVFSALILSGASMLSAEGPKKVAVLPFTMNADRDLGFLQEGILDMLASRLAWQGKVEIIEKGVVKKAMQGVSGPFSNEAAVQSGAALGADFVVRGSLTVFGDSVSVDAAMLSVKGEKPPVTVFVQSKGMESVIPEINRFAQKINAKIFGRTYVDREFAYVPRTPYASGRGVPEGASSINPNFRTFSNVDVAGSSFWKSRAFEAEIRALVMGDVTGDGQNELVLAEGTNIFVYTLDKGALKRLAGYTSSGSTRILNLDMADTNGNGKFEIFASRIRKGTVASVVLEFEGGRLRAVTESASWFFRVMNWPGRGEILLGQEKSHTQAMTFEGQVDDWYMVRDYFEDGIYELTRDGDAFVRAGEEPLMDLDGVYIFNFAVADLSDDQTPEVVVIDRQQKLSLMNMEGEVLHTSAESYGGTLNYLVINPAQQKGTRRDLDEKWLFLPARIVVADLDRNGQNEVIINQHRSSTYGLTERFRDFSDGKLVSLTWTGLSFDPNWESTKLSGCLSDYVISDLDNDGKKDLVVSLLQEKGASFFQAPRSTVVSYNLNLKEKKDK